jgi:hypothetical protein
MARRAESSSLDLFPRLIECELIPSVSDLKHLVTPTMHDQPPPRTNERSLHDTCVEQQTLTGDPQAPDSQGCVVSVEAPKRDDKGKNRIETLRPCTRRAVSRERKLTCACRRLTELVRWSGIQSIVNIIVSCNRVELCLTPMQLCGVSPVVTFITANPQHCIRDKVN